MGVCSESIKTRVIISEEKKEKSVKYTVNLRKEVKSFYIIKDIFSFLQERKKLDLIAYNKKLKKDIGVNIYDYIKMSGKKNNRS